MAALLVPMPLLWLALADALGETPTPEPRDWWTLLQQAVAFGIALATLYALVIRPAIRSAIKHFREAITEVVKAQQDNTKTLERVDHQLHPNGGKSAHDYARKAYEETQAIRAEQRHHGTRLDLIQGELTAQGWRLQTLAGRQTETAVALDAAGITVPGVPDPEEVSTP